MSFVLNTCVFSVPFYRAACIDTIHGRLTLTIVGGRVQQNVHANRAGAVLGHFRVRPRYLQGALRWATQLLDLHVFHPLFSDHSVEQKREFEWINGTRKSTWIRTRHKAKQFEFIVLLATALFHLCPSLTL